MKLTYTQRSECVRNNFWMKGNWSVVVRCKECHRHGEAVISDIMGLDGKLKFSHCDSCDKMTCEPVLKDKNTVVEVQV